MPYRYINYGRRTKRRRYRPAGRGQVRYGSLPNPLVYRVRRQGALTYVPSRPRRRLRGIPSRYTVTRYSHLARTRYGRTRTLRGIMERNVLHSFRTMSARDVFATLRAQQIRNARSRRRQRLGPFMRALHRLRVPFRRY